MTKQTFLVLVVILFSVLGLTACDNSDEESDEDTGPKSVALVVDAPADTPIELMRGIIEDPISQVLADRGYVTGENLTFNTYFIGDQTDESLDLSGNDVIVALAEGSLQRLLHFDIEQPIVFMGEATFLEEIRNQLDEEERSMTGVLTPTANGKRFELLLEMAPDIDTLFVPYDSDLTESLVMLETVQQLADQSDITIVSYEYHDADTLLSGVDEMPAEVDAIFISSDETTSLVINEFALLSIRKQVILSYDNLALAIPEVLMSYGTNIQDSIETAGRLVAQILDGSDASDLPFETTDPRLVISLGAAEAIGLEVPDSILQQASLILRDEVTLTETADVFSFCSASMESIIGSYKVCVTQSCNSIPNSQLAAFTDRVGVDSCTTEGLQGICSTEESNLYIYDGDVDLMVGGCGLNGGTWSDSTE